MSYENGIVPYNVWTPTRREARENRILLNPCEPCAVIGKQRAARFTFRLENGELADVCASHYLEFTDAARDGCD